METEFFSPPIDNHDILLRLGVSALAGLVLGIDRELRGIAAGIRTHALVAVSSAVIMISALMLFADVRDMEGVAAGAIFFAKGHVHNLTSAANIWLAASVGIAAGAGQMSLAAFALVFGIVIITVVRTVEFLIPGSNKGRRIKEEVTDD